MSRQRLRRSAAIRRLLPILAPVLLWLGLAASVAADTMAGPSLELIPAQVTASAFSAKAPVALEVHLRAGAQALANVSVSTFSNDGIAAGDRPELAALPANSEHSWPLQLTHDGEIVAAAKLYVRVAFDVADTDGPPVHRLLYATADITPRAAVASSALAKAEIIGDLTTLSHERSGQLLLQVTNQYSRGLHVKAARFFKPRFVDVKNLGHPKTTVGGTVAIDPCDSETAVREVVAIDLDNASLPVIPPGEARVVPFAICASAQVVPGKYTVMAETTLATDDELPQTVLSSHDVEVDVLGESDLLKLVGVPSFLFLPGALIIITWQLFWSFGKSSDERAKFPLQATGSQFWVVAIVLSLFAPLAYPQLTSLISGERRDYLVSYGFKDFAYTFALAIGFGLVSYLAWLGLQWFYRQVQAWQLRRNMPQTTDRPLQILDKLAKLKRNVVCQQVYPIGGNQADAALVLEPWSSKTELWLVPRAVLTVTLANDHANYYEAIDDQDQIVTGQIMDAATVAKRIRDGVDAHWWTIEWQAVGTVHQPVTGKPNAWADLTRPARLVR